MLFRQQAIAHHKNGLQGEILLLPRFAHSLLIAILTSWVIALAIWLFTSTNARKEGETLPKTNLLLLSIHNGV